MVEKYLKTLEFDEVLRLLEQMATCEETKQKIKEIRPCVSLQGVQKQQEQTSCAQTLILRYNEPEILPFGEIHPIVARLEKGATLSAGELLAVGMLLKTVQNLISWSKNFDGPELILSKYFNELRSLRSLSDTIGKAIVSEDEISSSASDELAKLRSEIVEVKAQIRADLDFFLRSPTIQKSLQQGIVTVRNERFVIPVKTECKNDIKGLVHDVSASGSTLFVEPIGVVKQNNRLKELVSKERKEIERILRELSDQAFEQLENIQNNHRLLIFLDVIMAKARLAIAMDASPPILVENGTVDLKGARHPLLPKEVAVPIDIRVGSDFSTLVITGPNTGGKTVALKTVGLLILMTMSGLAIPAKEGSVTSVFSQILVDLGDEQSIEQNLSTFSGHVKNIVKILEVADGKSLVLLDELGAGTDPVEGAGLAIAILEELRKRGTRVIATTHYAELKAYALSSDGVENASCEFDLKTLTPTYKFSIGVPGRSSAFAIAQRLGLSETIVRRAKESLDENSIIFEDVLQELDKIKVELQSKIEQNRILEEELREKRSQMESFAQELLSKENQMAADFKAKTEPVIKLIEETFDKVAVEIREIQREENLGKLEELRNRVRSDLGGYKKLWKGGGGVVSNLGAGLKRGDSVKIKSLQREGILINDPDKNGMVSVRSGNVITKLDISNLEKIGKATENFPILTKAVRGFKASKRVGDEIKLLGLSVDEALDKLDKFLDDAAMFGLHNLRIVHGKGTGKLRQAVHEYLGTCSIVKSFRLGLFGEGESGVTIVEI
ncbi:MAG: endonuclease MutS2 [Oscillospiraceae bacterium]|nr:endonuclease MutS2 [Oscillospiraceae bacterium]